MPETLTNPALSPAFWPRIIGYGAILGAVFLLIETVSMRAPPPDLTAEEEAQADLAHSKAVGAIKVAVLIAALFVFYASLTTIGVVAASVVLMGAMMLFFGERKYVLVAVLSLSIPLILYGFFRYVASVPIPLGIFGN